MRHLSLFVLILISAQGLVAAPAKPVDSGVPTPLEQALSDHACRGAAAAPTTDEWYQTCLSQHVETLRASFGRDLKRLAPGDRRTLDARCTPLQATRGHDSYVTCLYRELDAVLRRKGGAGLSAAVPASPAQAPAAEPVVPVPDQPIAIAAPPAADPPIWTWAAGGGLCLALAALWLVRRKQRGGAPTCRQCGAPVPSAGALCADCRHQAAESARRSAAERPGTSDQPGAKATAVDAPASLVVSPGQPAAPESVVSSDAAGAEVQARLREDAERAEARRVELEAEREEARRAEARRRREEEILQLSTAADAPPDVFDPYLVLGVARSASPPEIEAAYQAARDKYALDEVSHLGAELREHFKSKAQAADRAYRLLTEVGALAR